MDLQDTSKNESFNSFIGSVMINITISSAKNV